MAGFLPPLGFRFLPRAVAPSEDPWLPRSFTHSLTHPLTRFHTTFACSLGNGCP